jgi:hypothetical protein
LAAQAMLLESIARSLWEVLARRHDMDHGIELVVRVMVPDTDHSVVVEALVTLLGGCSAALVVLERQLEHVDDIA